MQTDVNRPTASINKSILTEGLEILSELLSRHGLRITLQADSKGESPSFDAELKLLPKGPRLFVEAKQTFYPRSIQRWNEILHSKQDQGSHNLLLIVPHHTARSFAQCRENGIFTIDLDGNAYLEWPGFYTDRFNPSQRPKNKAVQGTVFTAKASRLIRALLVRYPRPWTQQELIEATAISPGYVSTRLRALERSRYIRREARRFIHVSDPDRLLNAWTETYRFDRHRKLRFALSATSYEQGIHKISTELHRLGIGFAYTGWSGSHIVSPYAESNE